MIKKEKTVVSWECTKTWFGFGPPMFSVNKFWEARTNDDRFEDFAVEFTLAWEELLHHMPH